MEITGYGCLDHFLESDLGSLRIGHIDQRDLQRNDHINDDIVFPSNIRQCYQIEIIESCDGGLHQQILTADQFWANIVAHTLDRVASQNPVPGRSVESIEDE